MIKINLHPKKKGIAKGGKKDFLKLELPRFTAPELKIKGFIFLLIPLAVIGLEIFYYLKLDLEISNLSKEKNDVEIRIQRYRAIRQAIQNLEKQLDEQQKIKNRIEAQIQVYKNFAVEKKDVLKILYQISDSMPDGIWFNSLNIEPSNAELKGYALNPDKITVFYKRLSRYFKNIEFNSTEREKGKIIEFYKFELKMNDWLKNKKGG